MGAACGCGWEGAGRRQRRACVESPLTRCPPRLLPPAASQKAPYALMRDLHHYPDQVGTGAGWAGRAGWVGGRTERRGGWGRAGGRGPRVAGRVSRHQWHGRRRRRSVLSAGRGARWRHRHRLSLPHAARWRFTPTRTPPHTAARGQGLSGSRWLPPAALCAMPANARRAQLRTQRLEVAFYVKSQLEFDRNYPRGSSSRFKLERQVRPRHHAVLPLTPEPRAAAGTPPPPPACGLVLTPEVSPNQALTCMRADRERVLREAAAAVPDGEAGQAPHVGVRQPGRGALPAGSSRRLACGVAAHVPAAPAKQSPRLGRRQRRGVTLCVRRCSPVLRSQANRMPMAGCDEVDRMNSKLGLRATHAWG